MNGFDSIIHLFQWPQLVVDFPQTKAGSFAREILPKTSRLKTPMFLLIEIWFSLRGNSPSERTYPTFERGNISSNLPFERLFRHISAMLVPRREDLFYSVSCLCRYMFIFSKYIFIYTHIIIYWCVCTFFNAPFLATSWTSQHSTEVQWIEMLRRNAIAMESDPMRSNFLQLCHGLRASWLLKVGF